jgi:hypothetical protein
MWQVPLCTLTVIGPENSIEIDADNYSINIWFVNVPTLNKTFDLI